MFTGTGTAGAYHAGVLRAVQEAGVKIDIVAGRGIGVPSAMFAAIDGADHLWGARGGWGSARVARFYGWRPFLAATATLLGVALAALLVPLAVLILALVVFPVGFVLQMVGLDAGQAMATGYAELVTAVFRPTALPLYLPRFITVMLLGVLVTLAIGAAVRVWKARGRRRSSGALWWELLGAPLSTRRVVDVFVEGLWQIMRGATRIDRPTASDLGERYAQLLAENVGQPGFRELVVLVHDLDGRRDLVAALLAESYRRPFFLNRLGEESGDRPLEALDLAGSAQQHSIDVLAGALSIPLTTEPQLMTFSTDGVWRGETHRLNDRPESTARLLEEVAHAGAEQVVLVTSLPEPHGPHTLSSRRRDGRGRAGEHVVSIECASLRDALEIRSGLFQAVFQIRPTHNPLGPFDFAGCYDEHSDRRHTVAELMARGYEDGFRQFVDSVVGASGEWIDSARPSTPPSAPRAARATSPGEVST